MPARRQAAGFTLLEVVVGFTLLLGGVSVFGAVLGSTDRLERDSQVHSRVTREHRRNLNAIANHLSTAAIESLRGFDGQGLATRCTFQRVVSQDEQGPILGPDEVIAWVAREDISRVDGKLTGRVVLFGTDGSTDLLADRIPAGSFSVRQEGRNLLVHLTTYYRTTEDRLVQLTSETAVTLRN